MKVVLIACLLAIASSATFEGNAPIGNTPTFSLLEERLDNAPPGARPPAPKISITFPDGYTDNLILDHFFPEEDKIEGCHFMGHLEKEQEACVAMTGCIGSEDLQFTIMSDHVTESSLLKWKKDGSVEHIKSPYDKSKGVDNIIMRGGHNEEGDLRNYGGHNEDGDLRNPDQNDEESKIGQNIMNTGGLQSVQIPANMKMQIKVAYDASIRNKLGGDAAVEQYFNTALPHLQANYCHASFPSKIKIERIGKFIFVNGNMKASNKWIFNLRGFNIENLGNADLIVYMSDDHGDWMKGLAPIGTVCVPGKKAWWFQAGDKYDFGKLTPVNAYKMCIVEHENDNARFGRLVSHEIGHNLGLMHDFDKRHGGTGTAKSAGWPNGRCETNQNIMSYESSEKKWSECNKLDFEAHYVKHKAHWCLDTINGDACAGAPFPFPGGNCKDKNANCPSWKAHCSSANYGQWMTENCAKSCGKCGAGNVCTKTDKNANCPNWKAHCKSANYGPWMTTNCAKTCTC